MSILDTSRDQVRISDHAVLRYMERAMGLNVELVREHIMAIAGTAAAFGASSVRAEGLRFEIRGNAVVTVAPDAQHPSATSRKINAAKIARRREDWEARA